MPTLSPGYVGQKEDVSPQLSAELSLYPFSERHLSSILEDARARPKPPPAPILMLTNHAIKYIF